MKDCQVSCDPSEDGAGCNNKDLDDKLDEKFSTGQVSQCYQCEFSENIDGSVNGLQDCVDEITEDSKVPLVDCPKYADTACYWAASFHKSYGSKISPKKLPAFRFSPVLS